GKMKPRTNPFGEKASNSPPHGGSDTKPFRFPAARGNPLTSHVPSLAQRCLGLQIAILGAVNLQRSLLKCNLIFGTQKVAAQPVNLTTTQFSCLPSSA
ncbi:MAG: hypothetical protein SPF51_07080, partial [Candidatus Fimivicinus sp.]|nr:hypothetical protein [Candidatus Fimivicinus sp.]